MNADDQEPVKDAETSAGQGLVEYAIILVLIAVVVVSVGSMIGGDNLRSAWDWVKDLIVS